MEFDLMTGGLTWKESAALARDVESAGFSGMLFTEAGSVPWMMIQAAAMAAPTLAFTTGIAVAFPRSPMISAQVAWEMARNTEGRFRLGVTQAPETQVVINSRPNAATESQYPIDFTVPESRWSSMQVLFNYRYGFAIGKKK